MSEKNITDHDIENKPLKEENKKLIVNEMRMRMKIKMKN